MGEVTDCYKQENQKKILDKEPWWSFIILDIMTFPQQHPPSKGGLVAPVRVESGIQYQRKEIESSITRPPQKTKKYQKTLLTLTYIYVYIHSDPEQRY